MKYWIISLMILVIGATVFMLRTKQPEVSKQIVYMSASENLINVSNPLPGSTLGKNFSVTGEARGTWFFEANFPVILQAENGSILAQTPARAKGEWMTENFVPFQVDIKVPETYTGPATLILKKDNPSGLSEHDASISFDVTIK